METQTQNNINERLARAYQEVTEKKKKKPDPELDPVDKDELKGSHADREDGDIDNDGDEDESDKFLHKKRKAISKNVKKGKKGEDEEVVMNPKMTTASKSGEAKESTIRSKLISVLENKDKHTKGATPPEMMDDKLKGQGAKDMAKPAQDAIANPALDEPDRIKKDMDKLTANVKVSKKRKGDNPKGDSKVVDPNPIKDPAAMKTEGSHRNIIDAYKSMNEKQGPDSTPDILKRIQMKNHNMSPGNYHDQIAGQLEDEAKKLDKHGHSGGGMNRAMELRSHAEKHRNAEDAHFAGHKNAERLSKIANKATSHPPDAHISVKNGKN